MVRCDTHTAYPSSIHLVCKIMCVCGLFNDPISSSDYKVSNDSMINVK